MLSLENEIFDLLIEKLNTDNCQKLLEIAENYDNTKLRWVAWENIQNNSSYYYNKPLGFRVVDSCSTLLNKGTGFTERDSLPISMAQKLKTCHSLSVSSKRPSTATKVIDSWNNRLSQTFNELKINRNLSWDKNNTNKHFSPIININLVTAASETLLQNLNIYDRKKDRDAQEVISSSSLQGMNRHGDIDWELLLTELYNNMNMGDRVNSIPKVISAFRGKEKELVTRLLVKYANKMSQDEHQKLERLSETLQ